MEDSKVRYYWSVQNIFKKECAHKLSSLIEKKSQKYYCCKSDLALFDQLPFTVSKHKAQQIPTSNFVKLIKKIG